MARSQERSKRSATGARLVSGRGKRKSELAGYPALTKLSTRKLREKRALGGQRKKSLLAVNKINVTDKKGKTSVAEIKNVVENPANTNLVRRNIMTKGAIVETTLGKVKITSRPGQEPTMSGVLV